MNRFLFCLSLANLFFLDEWDRVATRWADAALLSPPHPTLVQFFAPVLLSIAALAVVFFTVAILAPRLSRRLLVAALLAPLNLFRITVLHLQRQDLGRFGAVALAAMMLIAAVYWRRRLVPVALTIPVLLATLLPIQIAYNLWRFERLPPPSAYRDQPSAPLVAVNGNTPRTIWIIFDELDQSILDTQHLPNFDRFRREASSHPREAFGDYTMEAIPSMLTGLSVDRARELGPGDLLLKHGRVRERWSQLPNIFDEKRDHGVNSAVLGSELPYCRAIGHSLASCDWLPFQTTDLALNRPSILDRSWYLIRTRPFAFPLLSSTRYFKAPLF
ncbi:MAG TPA: hypothetical protein VKS01_08325, partial [Bryobacteraceae bacterium]|nr:hypothetical protein [Bryobacteraceae bacterium]